MSKNSQITELKDMIGNAVHQLKGGAKKKKKETRGRKPKEGPKSKYLLQKEAKQRGITIKKGKPGRKKLPKEEKELRKKMRNLKRRVRKLKKGEEIQQRTLSKKGKADVDFLELLAKKIFAGEANEDEIMNKLKANQESYELIQKMLRNLYAGKTARDGITNSDGSINVLTKAVTAPGINVSGKRKVFGSAEEMLSTAQEKSLQKDMKKKDKENLELQKRLKEVGASLSRADFNKMFTEGSPMTAIIHLNAIFNHCCIDSFILLNIYKIHCSI